MLEGQESPQFWVWALLAVSVMEAVVIVWLLMLLRRR